MGICGLLPAGGRGGLMQGEYTQKDITTGRPIPACPLNMHGIAWNYFVITIWRTAVKRSPDSSDTASIEQEYTPETSPAPSKMASC